MKPYFIFKDKNSREMGISILKLPPRIKPEQRGEIINIPGRDGFLFESDNAYNHKTLEIECTLMDTSDLKKIMEIPIWLDGGGELIFSDFPDYYYEARIINSIPIERLLKRYKRFLIVFEVQPFSKKIEPVIIEKSTIVEEKINVLTYYDTPYKMILNATGNIEIHINDTIINLNDLDRKVIIDGNLMNVTDEVGNNLNNLMLGDFPKLKPGENTISIICEEDSTFTNLVIEYKGLWIW